ncbi:MAG TPA: hypothetical protein VJN50_01770 [Actinomycetota bacterium]|nr:hypothetical protein [Actinomycetota bacterium]
MEELSSERDRAVIERAVEQFVLAVVEGRFVNADEAAAVAFGVARLAEAEDPSTRSRW